MTYGKVIRVKAPDMEALRGFVQKDNLFVPEGFAQGRWWDKQPAVDIALQHGKVTLVLNSYQYAQSIFTIPYSSTHSSSSKINRGRSLEDILGNIYKNRDRGSGGSKYNSL